MSLDFNLITEEIYLNVNNNKINKFNQMIRYHKKKAKNFHLNVCEFLLSIIVFNHSH